MQKKVYIIGSPDWMREQARTYMQDQVGSFTSAIIAFSQTTPHAQTSDLMSPFTVALAASVALQMPINRERYETDKAATVAAFIAHSDMLFKELETALTNLADGAPN